MAARRPHTYSLFLFASHTHSHTRRDMLVWIYRGPEECCSLYGCGSLNHTATINTPVCVALPLWPYLSFWFPSLRIYSLLICVSVCSVLLWKKRFGFPYLRDWGACYQDLVDTCIHTANATQTHTLMHTSLPTPSRIWVFHSSALCAPASAFPCTLNVILWAPNCL